MKPIYSFLFTLGVFGIFLGLSLLIPDEGIPLSNGNSLTFPRYTELLYKDTFQYADISNIIDESVLNEDDTLEVAQDTLIAESDTLEQPLVDTTQKVEPVEPIIAANADKLKSDMQQIEFAEGHEQLLYPIFQQLISAKPNNKLIRILHYGDSQIEGDRITSYIRNQLQSQFGGSGVGLLPPVQQYNYQLSIRHYTSSNWYRWTNFPRSNPAIKHKRYGLMASFARFSPYQVDSLINDDYNYEAWLRFEKGVYTYKLNKVFHQCRVFYGYNQRPVMAEVKVNGETQNADIWEPSNGLRVQTWTFDTPPDKMALHFKSSDSPEVYAIALDDYAGVAVDNIPMRGSAGLFFTKMDQALFQQLIHTLNVKMIILQFGGNVVPYLQDFNFYERVFYAQLVTIKNANPNIPVVVIGPADMSINQNGKYVTHPSVEKVRAAIKRATFQAGFAYWDMYEAMGGRNSMPSWVFANPPLAAKDFIHFNPRGAKLVAEKFYSAFMYEYDKYLEENSVAE